MAEYLQVNWEKLLKLIRLDKHLLKNRILTENIVENYEYLLLDVIDNYYLNAIEENERNFSLIKSVASEKAYCDKLKSELEEFTKIYKSGEIDIFLSLSENFTFLHSGFDLISKLINANKIMIDLVESYIHSKYNDFFERIIDHEFDLQVNESKKEQNLKLKELFKDEDYYTFIISKLMEGVVPYCRFSNSDGKFIWDQNKKEHLVGFARKLEIAGRLKDEYSGKPQQLRKAFTSYFHCVTSERTWRYGDYLNNNKYNEFTFIKSF